MINPELSTVGYPSSMKTESYCGVAMRGFWATFSKIRLLISPMFMRVTGTSAFYTEIEKFSTENQFLPVWRFSATVSVRRSGRSAPFGNSDSGYEVAENRSRRTPPSVRWPSPVRRSLLAAAR